MSLRVRRCGGGLALRQRDDDFARPGQPEPLPRELLDGARVAPQVPDFLVELLVLLPDLFDLGADRLNLAALGAPLQVSVLAGDSEQQQRQNHRRASRQQRNDAALFRSRCADHPGQPNKNRRAAVASSSRAFAVRASQ